MRLKSLEIIGFKSFADKIKLDFDPGITAIVGPNGCGKSNISDAFRWVLGEQSAKSMRGGKMPDVIFAGTTQRKSMNFAEVTLTLDGIEGQLPIEYSELAVTRRLHRSGDSEYFINKHPVRLRDVQALFLDSGMGKDAYSIFEQGKIDQVINLSPFERRYIFEEAAGILRFLQRKKEALRKLEQTDLNVSRVKDIHEEVEKQIIVLEEQSEKARQYKENQAALDKLEKCVLVAKWEQVQAKRRDIQAKVSAQESLIVSSNAHIEGLQKQLMEARQVLAEGEKECKERNEKVYRTRSDKELQSREKQTHQEKLKDLTAKEKRWQLELQSMADKQRQREDERCQLLARQKDTDKQLAELEAVVQAQRSQVKILEEKLARDREAQQTKQKELFQLMQAASQCESELKQVNVRLENAQERQARIGERKERLSQAAIGLLQQSEEKKQLLAEAAALVEQQKDAFGAMEAGLQDLAQQIGNSQSEMERVSEEFSELKARQKALHRLREDMEGFSAGSKKLLQEASHPKSLLCGKVRGLYEYLVPEKGAEAALAAVMKPYTQTLVVEDKADFELVVEHIKKYQIKDISLVCAAAISTQETKGKGRSGKSSGSSEKEEMLPLLKQMADNPLAAHFLKDVYISRKVTAPLDVIQGHSGIDLWLHEGVLLDRHAVVFFSSQGEHNVFLREAELKTLEKRLHEVEQQKAQLELILQALQQKRNHLQQERATLDKSIRRDEMKLVELNFSVQKATLDLEKMGAEEKLLVGDWQSVKGSIEGLTQSIQALHEKYRLAKEIVVDVQQQTDELTAKLSKLVERVKGQAAEWRAKEQALHLVVDEQRKQSHALHVLDVKDLESVQQAARLEEEIAAGQTLQGQLALQGVETDKALKQMEHALADALTACQALEQQVTLRKTGVDQIEAKIQEKRQLLKKQEAERNQQSIQCAQMESNENILEKDLHDRHHLTAAEAQALAGSLDQTVDQMEKQVRHFRQLIEQAGDINMTSIEECDKHKTRYQFLNQQIDDLELSKDELIAIIADLDEESRKIFRDTFQQVQKNFKKNFEILFNGGEADLQLTEPDILAAGIEIIAKPPGKQMRSIQLLSGGEKCLTAMALLFAIFEVKPAPFCILDEIDAPLDDANIERFVNIVKTFVENCQFIIITHNKRTMAIADVICGVSMEERGVSKLLNINFSKVER